jgi:hypothetical protein
MSTMMTQTAMIRVSMIILTRLGMRLRRIETERFDIEEAHRSPGT